MNLLEVFKKVREEQERRLLERIRADTAERRKWPVRVLVVDRSAGTKEAYFLNSEGEVLEFIQSHADRFGHPPEEPLPGVFELGALLFFWAHVKPEEVEE